MKKFAMAAIAAAAMTAGVAQAYSVGQFTNGFVVPNVVHDANGTTAVGIVSKGAGCVFWTFFDQDSNHITDGFIPVTDNDYTPFIWSSQAGVGTAGARGYLVFTAGNGSAAACSPVLSTTMTISGNAFQVLPASQDVAFVPVIDGPLTLDLTGTNLANMGPTSLVAADGAVTLTGATTNEFSMRYFIDGATGGTDTNIVVWSTGDQRGNHTVFMYNDQQNVKSVNFNLTHTELDWFDVETIVGRPTVGFTDGFITWPVSTTTFATKSGATAGAIPTTVSVMTYSVISSPAFGAVQTVLGAHR
ncbi:MAG: hypothetical protein ACTS6O_01335 [Giesbergeria sp.]